jgi:hypothetical protein
VIVKLSSFNRDWDELLDLERQRLAQLIIGQVRQVHLPYDDALVRNT